jgi:EAL domain-containing protein (putative c-di-GMP-specific phosphodiesterase class I)
MLSHMQDRPRDGSAAPTAQALLDDRLRPVAQPIVDLVSGELVAEELLPLIAHPPECAARSAGRRVLTRLDVELWLVQQAAYIAAYGRRLHVSIGARSVRSASFIPQVARALERSAAEPALLTFEIDDGVAARETTAARRFAIEVEQLGACLAINDFSLRHPRPGYLRELAPAALKIDPWLVREIATDRHCAVVVGIIVEVARMHDAQTIAEGVYDQDTRAILRSLGVDFAQGYHRQRRS